MKLTVKLFGIIVLLSGISLLLNSEIFLSWAENSIENSSFYIFAIVLRLLLGSVFIVAAKESKYPGAITFFGYLFILAAIVFIFMGQESFQNFISSLIPTIKPYISISGLLNIAFGGFLIYAFSGNKKVEK